MKPTNPYVKLSALILFLIIILALAFYFNTHQGVEKPNTVNVSTSTSPVVDDKDTIQKDATEVAKEILVTLNNKDYTKFTEYVHTKGLFVSLTPYKIFEHRYAYVNGDGDDFNATTSAKIFFTKTELRSIDTNKQEFVYGNTDGKGDPIKGTIKYFFEKKVYAIDYLKADEIVEDQIRGTGNSLNTIIKDANGRKFVTFYFKGFNPQYEGMDWTTLYMIFEEENGQYKLRAIAKDNWTI